MILGPGTKRPRALGDHGSPYKRTVSSRAIRTLTTALAATALTVGTATHAAPPVRSGAPVEDADQLFGGSELLPVAVFMAAILAVILFVDDDDELPTSP